MHQLERLIELVDIAQIVDDHVVQPRVYFDAFGFHAIKMLKCELQLAIFKKSNNDIMVSVPREREPALGKTVKNVGSE